MCWGGVQRAAVCGGQLGGSGFGTGGLSAERFLKKWGEGAGEPVWLSGWAGLALGIFQTLQSCFLQNCPLGSGRHQGLRIGLHGLLIL